MPTATAKDEPDRPPITVLVTTLTCAKPPRMWPTKAEAKRIKWWVMPLAFITWAAKMKKGMDNSKKELTELAKLWEMGSIIKSPCLANEAYAANTKQ